MRKNVTKDRLLLLGSLTILTGVCWVSLEVYRSLVTDKITPQFQSEVTPLNPRIDIQVLDQIVSRRSLNADLQQSLESQLDQRYSGQAVSTLLTPTPSDLPPVSEDGPSSDSTNEDVGGLN